MTVSSILVASDLLFFPLSLYYPYSTILRYNPPFFPSPLSSSCLLSPVSGTPFLPVPPWPLPMFPASDTSHHVLKSKDSELGSTNKRGHMMFVSFWVCVYSLIVIKGKKCFRGGGQERSLQQRRGFKGNVTTAVIHKLPKNEQKLKREIK